MAVLREVSRYPVEEYADAVCVHTVDEIHKVLRSSETRGRSEVTCYLVAPASVKRMLKNTHKLDMSIAHILNVISEHIGNFSVAVEGAVLMLTP